MSNAFSTTEQSLHYQQREKNLSARLYSVMSVCSTVPLVNSCSSGCFGAKKEGLEIEVEGYYFATTVLGVLCKLCSLSSSMLCNFNG